MAHTIVTIVGSLRKEAFSLKIANAMAKLAPSSLKLDVTTLGGISFFNQDLEANPPADWLSFREKIQKYDAELKMSRAEAEMAKLARDCGAFVNLIPLQEGERVVALQPVREFSEGAFVVMATAKGIIKKTSLEQFSSIRATGIIALTIEEGDALIAVRITEGSGDLLLGTRDGWAIRFREEKVRPMGRTARGVRS